MTMDGGLPPTLQRLLQKVENDPDSRVFVQVADLYLKCDLFNEAIDVLNKGILRHPTYVAARMMRGKVYIKMRRVREAKSDFEAVLAAHPEHIQAYKSLAEIYREVGKLGEAVTICNKILAIDPQDHTTRSFLLSIHDEIATTDQIQALGAFPSPSKTSVPDSDLLDPSPEGASDPVTIWGDENFYCPSKSRLEPSCETDCSESVPAGAGLAALNRVRLETWLVSIEKRRKRNEL